MSADERMSDRSQTHSGRCECGGVVFTISGPLREVWNCHCGRCRRFTGHHMAATATTLQNIHFETASTLTWYEAHPTAHYGFCNVCGSSLFWRTTTKPDHLSVCAGTLDTPTGLRTTTAWWVSEAADYHERPDITEFDYES